MWVWVLYENLDYSVCCALINGNDEETNRYIHEKNRVKSKSLSSWVDGWTHEWIGSPWAPSQCHTRNHHFYYHIVLQHTDYGSNVQREETISQKTQTLEENYVSTLKTTNMIIWLSCLNYGNKMPKNIKKPVLKFFYSTQQRCSTFTNYYLLIWTLMSCCILIPSDE